MEIWNRLPKEVISLKTLKICFPFFLPKIRLQIGWPTRSNNQRGLFFWWEKSKPYSERFLKDLASLVKTWYYFSILEHCVIEWGFQNQQLPLWWDLLGYLTCWKSFYTLSLHPLIHTLASKLDFPSLAKMNFLQMKIHYLESALHEH